MAIRLGELLIERGVLTCAQVQQILEEQAKGRRPFGEIAERMFGLCPSDIEGAWAEQFSHLTRTIDPSDEAIDHRVASLISRRQAWQFGVMPIRRDEGDVMIATTEENLPRAARFVAWSLTDPVYFVLCTQAQLETALRRNYPLPGVKLFPATGAA